MTQSRDPKVETQTTEAEMPATKVEAPSPEQQAKEREKQKALEKTQADIHALNLDWGSFLAEAHLTAEQVAEIMYTHQEAGPAFRVNPREAVEQVRGLFELERVLSTLFLAIHDVNPKPQNLTELIQIFTPERIQGIPASERPFLQLMLWKLRTIVREENRAVYQHLNQIWQKTILTTEISKGFSSGITDLGRTIAEGKAPSEGNEIINFVKNHWGKMLLIGTAGYGLYKLFGGGKNKEKAEGGFFAWLFSLLSKIPGIGGIGMLVTLGGIFGLFGTQLMEWIKDIDGTVGKVAKFAANPTLEGLLDIAGAGGLPRSLEGMAGGAVDWAKTQIGMNEAKSEESRDARAEAVGAARLYQNFYGLIRPWKELSDTQKVLYKKEILETGKKYNFPESCPKEVPENYIKKYESFMQNPGDEVIAKEKAIKAEIKDGVHPIYGNLEEGIKKMDPDMKKFAGITDLMSGEEQINRYIRYLALSKLNIEVSLLRAQITAINASKGEGDPRIYENFSKKLRDPERLYLELQAFEIKRLENAGKLSLTGALPEDIKEYKALHEGLDALLDGKNKQVDKLMMEIEGEMKKGYTIPNGNTLTPEQIKLNTEIDAKIKPIMQEISMIEKEVAEISTRFLKENETVVVRLLQAEGVKKTLAAQFEPYMPGASKRAQIRGNTTTPVLEELNKGKGRRWFRMGSVKGGLVITGLGAGWVFANSADGEGIDNALATGGRIAGGMVPLLAEYLDARDAIEALSRGEMLNAGIYTASFVADVASTLLIFSGVFSGVGFSVKAGKSALIQGIKHGVVREVGIEGNELVIKGAGGAVLKKMTLSLKDIEQAKKVGDLVGRYTQYAKNALWGSLAVSFGGTGVAVAGAYLDESGELDIDNHTPPRNVGEEG